MANIELLLSYDDLRGTLYTFPLVGDGLDWHTHGEDSAHITIVARGSVKMEAGQAKGVVEQTYDLIAGQMVDTPASVWHRFTALTPDTRIYNLIKKAQHVSNT